ncbi:MAG: CTP synthase, partial [Candidatus Nanoarchaeia archaeon]|nr:CTP synthase [Candidatus Nanoarchaeia archaeon]
ERFLNIDIPKKNNITTGQVYKKVIDDERAGKYLGKTVQFIPHIPDEIKKRIKDASDNYDFCIIEIGGTIGDYENIPFLFAVKSLEREIGKENIIYILITYLPVPSHIEEMKTKPTQQAIRMLGENGIFADFIICRAKKEIDNVRKEKIERYANIKSDRVISEPDIDTIYRIPLDLEKDKLGLKILDEFKIKPKRNPNWIEWENLVNNIANNGKKITIAMVCKYIDIGEYELKDSYVSVNQAIQHACANLGVSADVKWIDSKKFEHDEGRLNELKNYNGIIVPGGFGSSGVEGKIKAIEFARKNNIPFLGLCYGMQLAIVEFARNVCNMKDANTTEVDENTKYPVIKILESQKEFIKDKKYGGTMRLGAYAAVLNENSRVFDLYKESNRLEEDLKRINRIKKEKTQIFRLGILDEKNKIIVERHRHRYEVNPDFVQKIQDNGLLFSGYHLRADKTKLMEFIELPKHKFFVATQSHPEFKSSLNKPSPLFYGFVKSCIE